MGRAFEYRRKSKEKRWDKMSKVFPKLAKSITLAAKEGGTDPDSNAKLRVAIANAKAENMPKDNIERAIRCFMQLIQQQGIQDLPLVFEGPNGWDFDRIVHELARTPSLRQRIILTGFVSDPDLAVLYSGALMFLYPSYYEGFGLPVLEAMQCGTPVLSSNAGSLSEIVRDAGILFDPSKTENIV